jgi:hypothetical protein
MEDFSPCVFYFQLFTDLQRLKSDFKLDFVARLKSCPDTNDRQKAILQVALPFKNMDKD